VKDVAGPMVKYLAVLAVGLIALILIPAFALFLPGWFGML
jgi:hypothetical protein